MTVYELIEKLTDLPGEAEVYTMDTLYCCVDGVSKVKRAYFDDEDNRVIVG